MSQINWPVRRLLSLWCLFWLAGGEVSDSHAAEVSASAAPLVRSAASGRWSEASTWEGKQVPAPGARVVIRAGHTVVYDAQTTAPIRAVHVAGKLSFAPDRDTRLDVGLIKIEAGEDGSEDGFECDHHLEAPASGSVLPTLEVGSADKPIDAAHTANIRLHYLLGMDQEACPALVCCAGRMDFYGAPLSRTWVKLGAPTKPGDEQLTLHEAVRGWRVGDRIIVTATTRQNKVKKTFKPSTRDSTQTEERVIRAIDGARLTLDKPLEFEHVAAGEYRADVANLSRNVIVESADPAGVRGHTMYHSYSMASISYAEFRHLGKAGLLGKYALHFHRAGDTMRGSSVIGASIWDSANRWLTIHGTNYLVVRDCVGYQSSGHGFFLEDGTEMYNVLDRNLAVQAYIGKPLPKQVIPFDKNDGAGFWWANSQNSFTRNVAAECDEYGYFFQVAKTADFDATLPVQQSDGVRRPVDVRSLPFIRFEDNEAHCQRRHAFNLGGGAPFGEPNVGDVGPDAAHPFVIRNTSIWNVHWAFHPVSPSVLIDGMQIHDAEYDIWRPNFKQHAYQHVQAPDVIPRNHYFMAVGKPPVEDDYPKPLSPVDDLPPTTVITGVQHNAGKLLVRGTTADNGPVRQVLVNGQAADAVTPNFAEWQAVVEPTSGPQTRLSAQATDAAGNREPRPHVLTVVNH